MKQVKSGTKKMKKRLGRVNYKRPLKIIEF